jgi:molybdate transport repressor ModE-like protein
MLNLERLRILHAISAYGSVSAAADMLHVTTSAISQQIGKLEREVRQRMLEKNGRGVRLTDAAELLVKHADRIIALVEQAEAELEAHRDVVIGDLSLAAFSTAARGLVPQALIRLRTMHPELRVELSELEAEVTIAMVSRGDLDLAIVVDWQNAPLNVPEGLTRSPLLDDYADIALPLDHPLADRKELELEEIAAGPWISWSRGSICDQWLLYTLRSRAIEPHIAHMAAEYQTQLTLVAAGLGISVVPRLGRGVVPAGVRIVPVRPWLSRHVYAIWRAEAARRPAIRATLEALRFSAALIAPPPSKKRAR